MDDDIVIEIKHKTEDPEEIKKYIIEAIEYTNMAIQEDNVNKYLDCPIKKIVYVPGRLINILTKL